MIQSLAAPADLHGRVSLLIILRAGHIQFKNFRIFELLFDTGFRGPFENERKLKNLKLFVTRSEDNSTEADPAIQIITILQPIFWLILRQNSSPFQDSV